MEDVVHYYKKEMFVVKFLILLHVLSAIVGVGPTFFGHVLTRKKQTVEELRHAARLGKTLDLFPKIGGTIALLTGLLLFFIGNYGSFLQLWLIGSLVLYVIIQVIVIGFILPRQKQLGAWLFSLDNQEKTSLPEDIQTIQSQINTLFYVASFFGVLLFIFMIVKPIVFS